MSELLENDYTEIYHSLYQGGKILTPSQIVEDGFDVICFCQAKYQPKIDFSDNFPNIIPVYCPFEDEEKDISKSLAKLIDKSSYKLVEFLKQKKKILVSCFAGQNRYCSISQIPKSLT